MAAKRPGNRALLFSWAFLAIAGASCTASPPPVTIRAGLLLDGRGGQLRDALISVANGRILRVGPWQGDSVTHDLSRYTVLPGLIDAHVHIAGYLNRVGRAHSGDDGETGAQVAAGMAANALATLRAGFTTVASMGAEIDKELRERIAAGRIPGPRILTSLIPAQSGRETVEELRQGVRRHKARGADFIKIFQWRSRVGGAGLAFSAEQLAALCGESHQVGFRAVVHAQTESAIGMAVAAGCDQVEHGAFASPDALALLANRGVWFDPQCGLVLRNYLEHWERFEGLPEFDSTRFAEFGRMRRSAPGTVRAALATPGLKVLFGSDATAGAHGRNAEDLVCWVREAGAAPMESLVAATSRNAEALGLGAELGAVAPGYQADLIALEGNPLEEIEAVLRVRFVMRGGTVYRGLGTRD